MINCPACHEDVNPIDDMGADMRIVSRCPKIGCNAALPDEAAEGHSAAQGLAKAKQTPAKGVAVVSILELAKARRAEVGLRIDELRRLEAELAQLDRMIAAAESNTH